ncbi:NAD-binding protein [Mycobacterium paraffinicum]|uniref:NAD-binding protein n=1 Tax=Mycobacterium paraffinicum TaxID=53378 RepID=UPI0021F28A3F|nr:NAD-binding protein [Mycobacterium paraffinicum]MCV7311103.1 NAD-binding protein [Mycobacterium paraffinicum]
MTSLRSFALLLADYRWHVLAGVGVAALVLGNIGFWQLWKHHPEPSDIVFWSFKLFTASTPVDDHLPVTLDIARFLAPLVAGFAGLSGLASLFRDRVQQMRIPLMTGHVVVCGLGDVGSAFLHHLREAGDRVVVIDSDAANPNMQLCHGWGVPVIVGDAQQERTLQAAGVRRASRLLALCPNDAVNTEIVAVASLLAGGRSGNVLTCLAQIGDPELCALLRIREAERADAASALDFFNTDEIGARLLLDEFPVDTERDRPHILIAGLDALGAWVVYHAARDWYDHRRDDTAALVVTVVDSQADRRVQLLLGHYPALEQVCSFITLPAAVSNIHRLRAYHADAGAPPLARAYVTADNDEQSVELALQLRHELDAAVPLVVALARSRGVARLLDEAGSAGGPDIDVFPTLERTCTVELTRGGSYEAIAHAIHRRWCAEQLASGKPAPPWSELDESRKDSSRSQARHIGVKLRSIGCDLAPLRDWDASEFVFSTDEVDTLAVGEHDRWMAERLADGWSLGEKDIENKKTPYLVPFSDLPDDVADYDRVFVREIPALLASAGLQVIRTQRK